MKLAQRLSHFLVKDVCVSRSGFDICVVQRLLHQLEVAGLAQELGSDIMPEIVEAKVFDASLGPQPAPPAFGSASTTPSTSSPMSRNGPVLAV